MNAFLGSIVLLPVEQILNQLLQRDKYIAAQLTVFSGKVMEVQIHAPKMHITLLFDKERIQLSSLDCVTLGLKPDASISGSASALWSLLQFDSTRRPLVNSGISTSGDSALIQDLYNTLRDLDIDWQDYLAPVLGDIITNELGELSLQAKQWSDEAGKKLRRNVRDYLLEEVRIIPQRDELDRFSSNLDSLRLAIDRAAARALHLQHRLDKSLKSLRLSA